MQVLSFPNPFRCLDFDFRKIDIHRKRKKRSIVTRCLPIDYYLYPDPIWMDGNSWLYMGFTIITTSVRSIRTASNREGGEGRGLVNARVCVCGKYALMGH